MTVVAYAVASDTGRKRRRNEDSYVVAPPLFAVADGMGGAQAGEVASKLAAATVEAGDDRPLHGVERVSALIREANRRVWERAANDPSASGMGTTMTMALVEGMAVAIGHVGDSRAYLVRNETMEQLTDDHSLVNELLKSGQLSPEEAHGHPQRSVIMRAVGTDPDVAPDAFTIAGVDDDIFLLCSDGLSDMVADVTILELVERHRDDLDRAVRALVAAANRGGGEDNITVVAFRLGTPAAGDETTVLPALDPEETTVESAARDQLGDTVVIPPDQLPGGDHLGPRPSDPAPARRRPAAAAGRLPLGPTVLVLLVVAIVLLVWGLLR